MDWEERHAEFLEPKPMNMRLDHLAYRVPDRKAAAAFFIKALGYTVQKEFDIAFDNGETAKCIALVPTYRPNPEIFVSDGTPESIVGQWVARHGPGVHHIAYQVDSVEAAMKEWEGLVTFSSPPIRCPEDDLVQVFTTENPLTGVVYELIERGKHGFCGSSVKKLMEASAGLVSDS